MTAVPLSKSGIFFDAAKSGLSFENLTAADFAFLDAWFNDCDGCLLDSEYLAMGDLGAKMLEGLQAKGYTGEFDIDTFITGYAGWHAANITRDIAEKTGIELDADTIVAAHKLSVIETLRRDVKTFEGMNDVLTLIAQGAGGKVAVVTSSEIARVQPGWRKTA
jgi:hypothetical protein